MKNKKTIIALVALIAIIAIFFGVYSSQKQEAVEGQKTITVDVIHGDESVKTMEVTTTAESLGEALEAEGIIVGEEGPYGIYIKTVDGETVNDANQEWWCLTKGGEDWMNSADQTVIEDGDKYEFTFTVGY